MEPSRIYLTQFEILWSSADVIRAYTSQCVLTVGVPAKGVAGLSVVPPFSDKDYDLLSNLGVLWVRAEFYPPTRKTTGFARGGSIGILAAWLLFETIFIPIHRGFINGLLGVDILLEKTGGGVRYGVPGVRPLVLLTKAFD
jgi:hypothetical protein